MGQRTVLIVDDDPSLLEVLSLQFQMSGFDVLAASGGQKAFELVQQTRIDLILTDIRMPQGNGVELIRRLKARGAPPPVIFAMTGFADYSPEELQALGADAVFPKPFSWDPLFSAANRVLGHETDESPRHFEERIKIAR